MPKLTNVFGCKLSIMTSKNSTINANAQSITGKSSLLEIIRIVYPMPPTMDANSREMNVCRTPQPLICPSRFLILYRTRVPSDKDG